MRSGCSPPLRVIGYLICQAADHVQLIYVPHTEHGGLLSDMKRIRIQVQYDALRKHQKMPGSIFFTELGINEMSFSSVACL